MNRRYIVAVVGVASVLAGSIVAVSQGQSESQDRVTAGSAEPPDSTPASLPKVEARTSESSGARGRELGVATYRNAAGSLCAAVGEVDAGALVDRRGNAIPFTRAGNCAMRPQPVAVQVTSQADDPATKVNDRALLIWGLAAQNVDGIQIGVGTQRRAPTLGKDGAFIASMPPQQGSVVLTLHKSDGNQEKLALPPAPDIDEVNRQLKAGEIPHHAEGGP